MLVDSATLMMYNTAGTAGCWGSSNDIPVVIVELGIHPLLATSAERYDPIRQAHLDNVNEMIAAGRPAALVTGMDQYSPHYHLDAPTYMILGEKTAAAVNMLLDGLSAQPAFPPNGPCDDCTILAKEVCTSTCTNVCTYVNGSPSQRGCFPSGGTGSDCTVCGELDKTTCLNECSTECEWINGQNKGCYLKEQAVGGTEFVPLSPTTAPTTKWYPGN